jgi:hypothetical protein
MIAYWCWLITGTLKSPVGGYVARAEKNVHSKWVTAVLGSVWIWRPVSECGTVQDLARQFGLRRSRDSGRLDMYTKRLPLPQENDPGHSYSRLATAIPKSFLWIIAIPRADLLPKQNATFNPSRANEKNVLCRVALATAVRASSLGFDLLDVGKPRRSRNCEPYFAHIVTASCYSDASQVISSLVGGTQFMLVAIEVNLGLWGMMLCAMQVAYSWA